MVSLIVLAVAVATSVLAVPATPANELIARNTGSTTWFYPGLGACGETNNDNDLVAAVSAELFDAQHPCNSEIRISNQGRSTVVRVVDRCTACAYNDIDLSPVAFKAVIGELGIGRRDAAWHWA